MQTVQPLIIVSRERHPALHNIYAEFASPVAANHTLLTLAEGLLRSGAVRLDQLLAQCVIGEAFGKEVRLRIPQKKYPELYRIYTSLSKGIKSAVLSELMHYAARYRKDNPIAATELLVNKAVIVEAIDVGEARLPHVDEPFESEPTPAQDDQDLNGLDFEVDFSKF